MDLNDKKRQYKYVETFRFALEGIHNAFIQEKNFRFHIVFSIIVILLSFVLSISKTEWMFILICIGGMVILELINTAIERIVDLVTSDYHPLAKQAKDIAAGAVLIFACLSVIIGLIIFIPKLLSFF
ncbi:diacylglycerol kinase family protein [Pseudoneobacillus sp. C159]